jgi:hypothetical protein
MFLNYPERSLINLNIPYRQVGENKNCKVAIVRGTLFINPIIKKISKKYWSVEDATGIASYCIKHHEIIAIDVAIDFEKILKEDKKIKELNDLECQKRRDQKEKIKNSPEKIKIVWNEWGWNIFALQNDAEVEINGYGVDYHLYPEEEVNFGKSEHQACLDKLGLNFKLNELIELGEDYVIYSFYA